MSAPTRLRQVDGGWLLARDLADQPRLPAARLAQHHIAAHRTWGVSAGLRVSRQDGELVVGAGLAVDRCGRVGVLVRSSVVPVAGKGPAAIVLEVIGDGPASRVRLRVPGSLGEHDVPLATLLADGSLVSGDGDRRWLRRPGPIRTLAGVVRRGARVQGETGADVAEWRVGVDLLRERLDAAPAVVATLGGPPVTRLPIGPNGSDLIAARATVQVADVTAEGFTVTVRHHVIPGQQTAPGQAAARPRIFTTPLPVTWLALLPADRTQISEEAS